jgi:signal peptidase I
MSGMEGTLIQKTITIKSLIGNLLFAAILLFIATRFFAVFTGSFFPMDIVTSDSMSPSLMQGDIIAWTPTRIQDVQVGDVIVFKSWLSWSDQKLIVHRVVDIKTDFGKPALVTKGDANTYTDQAGAHAPEPYIIEKNFVGKVLSIGNQPLKIPFIGVVGIWLNDGFKLLSQCSAAKGTATSVGIFTPLIISVILLVLSLFVLPERLKTPKEKIRVNIFGFQSLNIKQTALFFLSIFIIFFIIIHFFAYDSVSATVGVGEFPEKSEFELGSIKPGQTSVPRPLPVINPGVLPVKGIIFGKGQLSKFINCEVFTVQTGKAIEMNLTATAPNGTANGTFAGIIAIYSSPVWLLLPDGIMEDFCRWNGEATVYILDILSACIFTTFTITLILLFAFIENKYRSIEINLSWHYAPKTYLKKGVKWRISSGTLRVKRVLSHWCSWLLSVNLATFELKPIIIGSALAIPLILLLNSEILVMILISLIAGLTAYLLHCKTRKSIVLTSVITMTFFIGFFSIKTFFLVGLQEKSFIESVGLGMGAVGIYLLVFVFFVIPLSLISWYVTHTLRNVKERKDPLLILEGRCDL